MPSDRSFVSVDMKLANQCGSECLMCPREFITRPKGMMSEDVFNIVSYKLTRAGMNACHGRGGNLKDLDIYELNTSELNSGRCGLFQFHTFVTWEAEVLACCHDITGAKRIGNLINDDVSVIAEREQNILKSSMSFSVCRQCDEPLRHVPSPQDSPPEIRKERIKFFSSINRNSLS